MLIFDGGTTTGVKYYVLRSHAAPQVDGDKEGRETQGEAKRLLDPLSKASG